MVFGAEAQELEAHGHTVVRYQRHNDELQAPGKLGAIRAGIGTVWASQSYRALKNMIARDKPHLAHFHNTFPLISPAAYYACAEAGVPVVQTLHNYRLLCPGATFVRNGRVCEACLGRSVAWPGVAHGCYRGSRPATAAVATMLATHRALGTWRRKVELYIALTEFARQKFVAGGLPAERIAVKPNFVRISGAAKADNGEYAVFAGRLSAEKGPQLLVSAWRMLPAGIPLCIIGDGPLRERLVGATVDINFTGRRTVEEVRSLLRRARFLVFPSTWYEGFPMVIAEAYAYGLPVIASRLGSTAEIVQNGVTGLHFEPGDAADLAAKMEWAWNHPPEMARMGRAALAEYQAKYTPERNYEMLMEIYDRALSFAGRQTVA